MVKKNLEAHMEKLRWHSISNQTQMQELKACCIFPWQVCSTPTQASRLSKHVKLKLQVIFWLPEPKSTSHVTRGCALRDKYCVDIIWAVSFWITFLWKMRTKLWLLLFGWVIQQHYFVCDITDDIRPPEYIISCFIVRR